MPAELKLPSIAARIGDICADRGATAFVVGGWVRDALLGRGGGDLDFEVHGATGAALAGWLAPLGQVSQVGRSFPVIKLSLEGEIYDLSAVPTGGGPLSTSLEAAVRRRDLTINALLCEARTGRVVDLCGGRLDLDRRRLHMVDAGRFGEDPLRVARVARFAAVLGFQPSPELVELCQQISTAGVAPERVRAELERILLQGADPEAGLRWLGELGVVAQHLPELQGRRFPGLGQLGRHRRGDRYDDLLLGYGLLMAELAPADRLTWMERFRLVQAEGRGLRGPLLRCLDALPQAPTDALGLRALADELPLRTLAALLAARGEAGGARTLEEGAMAAGVWEGPLPPLVQGAELLELGYRQGPDLGARLKQLRQMQHRDLLPNKSAALEWAAAQLRT